MTRKLSRLASVAGCWAWPAASPSRPSQAQAVPKTIRMVVAYPAGGVSDVVARALADKAGRAAGQHGGGREQGGRQRHHRHGRGRQGRARRRDAGLCGHQPAGAEPAPRQVALRPAEGHRAGGQRHVLAGAAAGHGRPRARAISARCWRTRGPGRARCAGRPRARPRWATSCWSSCAARPRRWTSRTSPTRAAAQQMNDALGAQFEILSINAGPAVAPQIQARASCARSRWARRTRLESLPKVPTLAELGFPAANLSSAVRRVRARPARPPILIAKYNAEINKALASPELRARLVATDNVPDRRRGRGLRRRDRRRVREQRG